MLLNALKHAESKAHKDQTKKELNDIITPLNKLKGLGEIKNENCYTAVALLNNVLLETGDFACKGKGISSENVNYTHMQEIINTAKDKLQFKIDNVDVTLQNAFRNANDNKCLDNKWSKEADKAKVVYESLVGIATAMQQFA